MLQMPITIMNKAEQSHNTSLINNQIKELFQS